MPKRREEALVLSRKKSSYLIMTEYIVLLTWDDEASVWVAENDDIPIALESPSLDTIMERAKLAAPELLELNDKNNGDMALRFTALG
jgi:hypothetical protein